MTTRRILNNFDSSVEQKTYEDLVGEFTQLYGIDVVYIARGSQSASGVDLLFGDDPTKMYNDNYTIEMYIQSVDNFEGGEIFSKFGLSVKKQARFFLPLRAFQREVDGEYERPREGDLLWLSNFRALFEIKFVNEEHVFYDFGKKDFYGFELIVEKFRYNDEIIDTGMQEIDNTLDTLRYTYIFNMGGVPHGHGGPQGFGTYTLDEIVTQANSSAEVIAWDLPTGVLKLANIKGEFILGQSITGQTSNAIWYLVSSELLDSVNHKLSDNQGIENEANTIINWNEENPFGQT